MFSLSFLFSSFPSHLVEKQSLIFVSKACHSSVELHTCSNQRPFHEHDFVPLSSKSYNALGAHSLYVHKKHAFWPFWPLLLSSLHHLFSIL